MILRRSPRFTLLLVILVGLISFKVYRIWEEGLPELPSPREETPRVSASKERRSSLRSMRRNTANIIKKNLFDPKRGAGAESVSETTLQNQQKAEDFVLLGTLITSGGRRALIRVLPTSGSTAVRGRRPRAREKNGQMGEVRRISIGEPVGEFQLAEIQPHKVILKKGSEQVELVLDFISRPRKIEKPKSAKPKKRAARKRAKPSRRRPR